ncbi:MAG TPA: hypothetical protein VGQ42_07835 [Candidatus Dormibacteraeota bacterium]|nr:hypothetical protein [Candidatus Dormibacteraeota bacterium]
MTQPSPCPRCGGSRAWCGASDGPTVPVLCAACGREATACPSCGWEWTGLPRNPRLARRGTCISCQVLDLAGRRASTTAVPEAFDERPTRSRLLQRLADVGEAEGESRWRCYRAFGEVVEQADRRAEAVARLEAGLRWLGAVAS